MSKKKKKPLKKLKTSKVYDILRVDWEDHWTGNKQWLAATELETRPLHCVSVGIKAVENKETLTLVQNMGHNEQVADSITILKKCITCKTKLGEIKYGKETQTP